MYYYYNCIYINGLGSFKSQHSYKGQVYLKICTWAWVYVGKEMWTSVGSIRSLNEERTEAVKIGMANETLRRSVRLQIL
jgi:hypothetical protein